MIILEQGQNNLVYVVASRNKQQYGGNNYLFSLSNKLSEEKFRFIPFRRIDAYSFPNRFDTFEIKIDFSVPQSLTGNTLGFTTNVWLTEGEYYYKIYQQVSNKNLNPSLSTDVVDEGMMKIIKTSTDLPVYDNDNYYMKVFN
jgi:hypothetical protein